MTNGPADISPADLATVWRILHDVLPKDTAVWVFGSRAKWTTGRASDLDLAVDAGRPLTRREEAGLSDQFEQSDIPYKVDVVDWHGISSSFRRAIEKDRVPLPKMETESKRRRGKRSGGAASTPSEWREHVWGDLATLEYGRALRGYDSGTGDFQVYGTNGPIGWHKEALCPRPGVIVGRKGVYRGVHYSPKPFFVIDTAFYLEPRIDLNVRWAYYALLALDINSLDSGSAIPSTTRDSFYRLPVWLPPRKEQDTIAHILGTLDDKIELNRRMSETLEAMARALFKSWFVDFDPVRAKTEGRDTGLPKQITDLFPDSFVESELGEIPEGWCVSSLSNCTDVARGLSYDGSGLSDEGVPMHNLNSVYEGGGYKFEGLKHYSGAYKRVHIAHAGDLIVANTEQGHERLLIGYAAIVPACFRGNTLFSHHIFRVRVTSDSPLTSDYLCHLLNTPVMHDTVSGYANGTTVNMLPMDGLKSPLVVVPPEPAVAFFSNLARAIRLRRERMIEESRTLAALRDALLPKLISGSLRVREAERFMEAL